MRTFLKSFDRGDFRGGTRRAATSRPWGGSGRAATTPPAQSGRPKPLSAAGVRSLRAALRGATARSASRSTTAEPGEPKYSLTIRRTITYRVAPLNGWGRSSVGRAPQWHCGGQGFESPRLHHPCHVCFGDGRILSG